MAKDKKVKQPGEEKTAESVLSGITAMEVEATDPVAIKNLRKVADKKKRYAVMSKEERRAAYMKRAKQHR